MEQQNTSQLSIVQENPTNPIQPSPVIIPSSQKLPARGSIGKWKPNKSSRMVPLALR